MTMTSEQFDQVCDQMAAGKSFRAACAEVGVLESTARMWLGRDGQEDQRARVKAARAAGCDAMADECIEIADGEDDPADKRVRIDTRLRLMGKWNQTYSEKVKHVGGDEDDAPLSMVHTIALVGVRPDGNG